MDDVKTFTGTFTQNPKVKKEMKIMKNIKKLGGI